MSLPLFDTTPPAAPRPKRKQTFAEFHAENPHVFRRLLELAREYAARHERFGVKALVERLRWDASLRTHGRTFKLDNSHVANYARLLWDLDPALRPYFRVKER